MSEMNLTQRRTVDLIFALEYINEKLGEDALKEILEQIISEDPGFWNIWEFTHSAHA